MGQNYDLVITGAGPTGLMAAKTAAESGLKVVVIERRYDISKIRRACCAHLILDDDYENEEIKVENGKIIFTRNGFEVGYTGPIMDIANKNFYSPKGSRVKFAHSDGKRFAVKVDKGHLLKELLEECEKLDIEFRMGTVAYDAKETDTGVELSLTKAGKKSTLQASKIIEAGGCNAHITGALGMNEERTLFAQALVGKFLVEGQKEYNVDDYSFYYGQAFHSNAAVIMDPSLYGPNAFEVTILGSQRQKPLEVFEAVRNNSPISHLFKGAKVKDSHACTVKAFSSLKTPHKKNILIAGDAAAFVEVQIQGGFSCGYHAARAIAKELNNENGYEEYTKWWQDSFEFNAEDYLKVAQGYAFVPFYADDELDYMFALTEDQVLEGTNSQYKTPKLFWASIMRHKDKIKKEKPEIYEKIKKIDTMSLSTTF